MAAADPALLDLLGKVDIAIVVDPLDGTANFAAGVPPYAVMASVVARGETVAGILYDPLGRDCLLAARGDGAFLQRMGGRARVRVASPAAVQDMVGSGPVSMFPLDERRQILRNLAEVRVFANYRCAVYEYLSMATRHQHFCLFRRLMAVWDHLAGCLIVEEAGGYARRPRRLAVPGDRCRGRAAGSDRAKELARSPRRPVSVRALRRQGSRRGRSGFRCKYPHRASPPRAAGLTSTDGNRIESTTVCPTASQACTMSRPKMI